MDPASLRIVEYPHPALRARTEEVPTPCSSEVQHVAQRMLELMREAEGVGLAAPQVDLPWRLFVCHVPEASAWEEEEASAPQGDGEDKAVGWTAQPLVCVNPRLRSFTGPPEACEEGCLSLPGVRGDVLRPPLVTLEAHNLEGRPFSLRCKGLLSRCVQHEFDHLEGVLIIDRMTQLSRLKNRSLIRDLERAAAR